MSHSSLKNKIDTEGEVKIINGYALRRATTNDVDQVCQIEKEAFKNTGTPTFTVEQVSAWLEVNPQGFWVAEKGAQVVGFSYFQLIKFDLTRISGLRSFNQVTDDGYTRKSHDPAGKTIFGLTLDSIDPGAGLVIGVFLINYFIRHNFQYIMGTSRVPGFAGYLEGVKKNNCFAEISSELEAEIALWYALESAIMVKGKISSTMPPKPNLSLPPLEKPDPLLAYYLAIPGSGLYAFLPDFIHDPPSRDFAFLTLIENPGYRA